ncbi:MAG: DNA replication and repair protein RecF [Blastocatellia bacterium]|nr:DNA replication and repair protein RecF [Blastocatellia bacterium]
MNLALLEASGFRNLSGSLSGQPGLNFLWGQNGQGKTSWLEAIAILGSTKSFRTHHLSETVTFGGQAAHLTAEVHRRSRVEKLEIHLEGSQKHLFINSKRVSVGDFLGHLDSFLYSREEMAIVRGEPGERRRFMDRGVLSLKPGYVQILADYNRTLKQKNALLKTVGEDGTRPPQFNDLLDVWNVQMVEHGTAIHRARTEYVNQLNQVLDARLFGNETVTVRYQSSLEGRGDLANYAKLITERLQVRREAEIAAGHALIGPHRDDLEILADGKDVAKFGSSGQQRSALLVLELAQLNLYHRHFDEYPLFLLDDIDAELDRDRIRTLLDHLEGQVQVFVTTSKKTLAEEYTGRAALSQIVSGQALTAVLIEN